MSDTALPPTPHAADGASAGPRARARGWFAVVAVTTGVFSLVTAEILPIGLLTPIGADFRISPGTAGLMMTLPGIVAAVAAPVVTVATRRADRRTMLCLLLLVLTLADLLNATASVYWAVLVARVALGLVIGAFWSIGSGLAPRLVEERQQARANTVLFSAIPLGSVLGVPAGVFLGGLAGWRAAFLAMAALTALVLAALLVSLPPLPPLTVTGLGVLRGLLTGRGTRTGLAATFLIVVAHFGSYTYVTPFLADTAHAGPGLITGLLLAYGAAGLLGNVLAGGRAARALRPVFGGAAVLLAAATLLLPLLGRGAPGAGVLLMLWGVAYGAVPVCSLTWFHTAAPHSPEGAGVVFTSSFQATISIGSLAGGLVVDHSSPAAVMVVGGAVALLAAATVGAYGHRAGPEAMPQPDGGTEAVQQPTAGTEAGAAVGGRAEPRPAGVTRR
ncbi:MFS transporter [Streptomyces sp. NRRL S-350]|uniref:MFS transporter n=1 Tax=Streptomyces sp. NRRL S-350 TaxID=1463902 RepID=UPI0007C5D847|nr:MFS transporter [Streptomyces sp. NRRL S-350]